MKNESLAESYDRTTMSRTMVENHKDVTCPPQPQESSLEQCSFVVHILAFPVGMLYVAWVLVSEETLEAWHITYYPPKSWALHIPTSLLCLLFAALFLYPALNALSAPQINSLNILQDEHTRRKPNDDSDDGASSPTLYDLDPANLKWYRRSKK
jgi:hypothetical protein